MFRRRRRDADLVVFDLSEDGVLSEPAVALDDGSGDGRDDEPAPPRRRTPAQARRQLVAAGSVLVVGLGAWGVTAALNEHRRVERLTNAPGGVRSLAQAPEVLWQADTESADEPVFAPGLVVVRRGTVLHALDAGTGEERWQVEVGGDPICSLPGWATPTNVADPLVCWNGRNTDHPTVTVVRADGTSVTRELPGDFADVHPGPDGTLVTVRRVGPPAPDPDLRIEVQDDGMWTIVGDLPRDGQDAVVRLEDAATGEERWERTVAYRPPADVWPCVTFVAGADGRQDVPDVQVSRLTLMVYPSAIQVNGCGLDATFAPNGTPDADTDATAGTVVWPAPYADGGYLAYVQNADRTATALRGPDGSTVAAFDDELLRVMATDGTGTDVRLVGSYGHPMERRTDNDKTLWTGEYSASSVLVRADGVAVAQRLDGTAWGVDLDTGETLWTQGAAGAGAWPGANAQVEAAFTDGAVALLAYRHIGDAYGDAGSTGVADVDARLHLVAFDLATGQVRWQAVRPDEGSTLWAAQGRLVEVVGGTGSETSVDPDGTLVRRAPGTVRVLR